MTTVQLLPPGHPLIDGGAAAWTKYHLAVSAGHKKGGLAPSKPLSLRLRVLHVDTETGWGRACPVLL